MKVFLVLVTCAHIQGCPLKETLASPFEATSKESCEKSVKQIIDTYGYKSKHFSVSCEEKK